MRAKFPYKKKSKRAGCGIGSGHGKTACRGQKGQKSRSGVSYRAGWEGGQNPLYRRLPKRGFNQDGYNLSKPDQIAVNVERLGGLNEKEISPEILHRHGVIKNQAAELKILGDGELKVALSVKAHKFSKSAKEKIEKAGGRALVIENTKTV